MKDDIEDQNVAKVMKKNSDESPKSQRTNTKTPHRNTKSPQPKWSKRVLYIIGSTAVLLFALLILERNGVSEESMLQTTLSGKVSYIDFIRRDPTLYNAVKHDLLQDVNITDTNVDYSLTVDGLIADEKKAVILYTLKIPNQESRKDSLLEVEILDGNGVALSSYGWLPVRTNEKESKEKMLTNASIHTVEAGVEGIIPDTLILNIKIDDKQLHVTIQNDQNRYAHMKKTVQPEQTFSIGDQKLTVHEVVITPLTAYVKLTADPLNTRKINGMISLSLMNKERRFYPEQGGYGDVSLTDGYTARFFSTYFDDSSPVYLVSEGAYISDKDTKLVVNTDTKETLETPSDNITLSEVLVKDDQIEIGILTKEIDLPVPNQSRSFMLLDSRYTFTDSEDNEYKILNDFGTGWNHLEGSKAEQMSYYSIPKENYKQPLTFAINEYPGYVKEKVKILLDSK
ncbi:DUF4179 domain-containing protein [Paenibacillus sp. Marseille-Q4541]|uniref:DUF4179 domain-containing protein n=1 Tax=Paenibacillus sp. Marseille-Q4541 TaxID=2831522 RepID=UPI001BA76030|nr:DUF4179 domain-containing protein [Paenibacillus sp. Marseille-Q4541]